MLIRTVEHFDLTEIHTLNESILPHVNSIPISDFEEFMRVSSHFLIIEKEGELAGFVIVLGPGQEYDSENYEYYTEKYKSFDYVDRVVISEKFRGKGLGSELYKHIFENTKEERITCEVNIKPPNMKSIQFHQMLGFEEVHQHYSEGGKKFVSLMVKELT